MKTNAAELLADEGGSQMSQESERLLRWLSRQKEPMLTPYGEVLRWKRRFWALLLLTGSVLFVWGRCHCGQ